MDETLYSAETNEQYLQFAGYEYDKKNIENLSKMNFLISEIFVRSFSEPRIWHERPSGAPAQGHSPRRDQRPIRTSSNLLHFGNAKALPRLSK